MCILCIMLLRANVIPQLKNEESDLVTNWWYLLSVNTEVSLRKSGNSFLNNQPETPFIQIYSVIKLYMFRAPSLPIIRSFLFYIRHW